MGQDSYPPEPSAAEPEVPTFEAIYRDHARWVWGTMRCLGVPEGWCVDATREVLVSRQTVHNSGRRRARTARVDRGHVPRLQGDPAGAGDEVVLDVALDSKDFGRATIYDCLLSEVWRAMSGPWPP